MRDYVVWISIKFLKLWVASLVLTFAGKMTNSFVNLNLDKNCLAKRSKKREAKLCVKYTKFKYFDAKLRFALFASLRSAIFSEIKLCGN